MKKKILAITLCIAMLAIAIGGATLAYFTDDDAQKNVMTTGGVSIIQNEQQRGKNDELVDFVQNKPLMPMVDTREEKTEDTVVVGGWFNPAMKNVVDKIISVTNTKEGITVGTNREAYVRTLIAFEGRCDVQGVYIGKLWNREDWEINWVPKVIDGEPQPTEVVGADNNTLVNAREVVINGVVHTVIECIYKGDTGSGVGVLPYGETTAPSLKQIFMAPTANNEVADWFGTDYTIYALTQATQVAGFKDAETALDTAFGDPMTVSDQVIFDWFKDIQ